MSHAFLVLHFGSQCPWLPWTIEQTRNAAAEVGGVVKEIDVSDAPELAACHRLFFPFMTIVDGTIRLPSPTPAEQLVKIVKKGISAKSTIFQPSAPEVCAERILPLTVENMNDTCPLCIPDDQTAGCLAKQAWALTIADKVHQDILGFVAYQDKRAMSAVEFLPAAAIPYPLPGKEAGAAFITCLYSLPENSNTIQDGGVDYRGQVLNHLLCYLRQQGYTKVQVVAGRRTPFPNGPVPFFLSYGFKELLQLDTVLLTEGQEELVLMEHDLLIKG